MIRGLWGWQVYAIIDVKSGDYDADSYKYDPMVELLDRWENINKDKHGKHCHNRQKNISVCSFYQSHAR